MEFEGPLMRESILNITKQGLTTMRIGSQRSRTMLNLHDPTICSSTVEDATALKRRESVLAGDFMFDNSIETA